VRPSGVGGAAMSLEEAARLTQRRVDRLVGKESPMMRVLRRLVKQAAKDVEARVLAMQARYADRAVRPFSLVQQQEILSQLDEVVRVLTLRLDGARRAALRTASKVGLQDVIRQLKGLERHYRGVASPLQIEQASKFAGLVDGVSRSVMQLHPNSSMAAYGKPLVARWEEQLSRSVLAKEPMDSVMSKIVESAREPGMLQGHNYGAPTFERWRAERIYRTEVLETYNGARLAGMEEAAEDLPGLMKQIREHSDSRTAWDSRTVHLQVRALDKPFEDGAGHVYQSPPGRPNDRGYVLPWRREWGVPGNLGGPLDVPGGPSRSKKGKGKKKGR
jgi:hypothetical protein